jgi:hypothetical protein
MKKIICVIILFLSYPVFAANWSARSVTNDKASDMDEYVCLKDAAGNVFFVEDGLNIADEEADAVLKQKDIFYSMQFVKIKELKFHFEQGILEISLVPSELKYENNDLTLYLSTGMLFSVENMTLVYNFRIRKDNYFLRINGNYISEKVLCDKILEAVQTPQTFVQRRDPDYLLSSLDRLAKENEALKRAIIAINNRGFFSSVGTPVDDKLVERIISLKAANQKMTQQEIETALEKEKMQFTSKAVMLILNVYFNEFPK